MWRALLTRNSRLSRKTVLSSSFREHNRDFATGKSASKFCSSNGQERVWWYTAALANFVLGQCEFEPHLGCRWTVEIFERGRQKDALSIVRKNGTFLSHLFAFFTFSVENGIGLYIWCFVIEAKEGDNLNYAKSTVQRKTPKFQKIASIFVVSGYWLTSVIIMGIDENNTETRINRKIIGYYIYDIIICIISVKKEKNPWSEIMKLSFYIILRQNVVAGTSSFGALYRW